MTWHEDDDVSSESNDTFRIGSVAGDKKARQKNSIPLRVCVSIGRRRAATQQHFASIGEVHHGAAGGAVVFPGLPASGPGYHHRQLVSLQVRRTVQGHSREQALLPVPQVHTSQAEIMGEINN